MPMITYEFFIKNSDGDDLFVDRYYSPNPEPGIGDTIICWPLRRYKVTDKEIDFNQSSIRYYVVPKED